MHSTDNSPDVFSRTTEGGDGPLAVTDLYEVSSYDDLLVISSAGAMALECPSCGVLETPRRAPTLSDFTNVAIERLSDLHPSALRPTALRPTTLRPAA
jgi:hypothetical protein